jgi:hypothetical protein
MLLDEILFPEENSLILFFFLFSLPQAPVIV